MISDVLFYNNYTPVADLSAIAICLSQLFLLRSTYTMKQKNYSIFRQANICIAVSAMMNILFHELVVMRTTANAILIYLTRDANYVLLMYTHAILCIYVCNLVDLEEAKRRIVINVLKGVFLFLSFVEVISPLTRFGFWMDDKLQIHQNYYFEIFRFSYVFYTIFMVTLLVVYRRKFIAKMFHCIRNILIMTFFLMTFQASLLSTSYTCISYTFFITGFLFLFHYNSYDEETGTLDAKGFKAYIKSVKNQEFNMIYLYLHNMTPDTTKKLAQDFFRFNEKFFRDSCTFRLRDEKLVMVYTNRKNKYTDEQLEKMLEEFETLYDKYHIDYRIVIIRCDERIRKGKDYLALDEYIESNQKLNTKYICKEEDITTFLKNKYILKELQDIHNGQNLSDERVLLFCQPVLNTTTNTFSSAEALMRLNLPNCGMVYPDQFIPLAEQHGYIHTLSKIILHKTCMEIRDLEEKGIQLERVSVNFSISELRNESFCDDIIGIISDTGVDFSRIALELTESRNEEDFENVRNIMDRLQGLGIKFYLDDFGTGYSNFERIISLPIDIIKFDRSLTILAGKDKESHFLVGSFAEIFKKTNYQILFEGIENARDETQCKEMDALYLQGFMYSKPIPAEKLQDFYADIRHSAQG